MPFQERLQGSQLLCGQRLLAAVVPLQRGETGGDHEPGDSSHVRLRVHVANSATPLVAQIRPFPSADGKARLTTLGYLALQSENPARENRSLIEPPVESPTTRRPWGSPAHRA